MKTALVTGVSRGLGLAVARRLLESGWFVCGTSRSLSREWSALAAQHPDRAEWRACDLGHPETIRETLFSDWIPHYRPLHGVVNNAAVAYDDLVTNADLGRFGELLAANVVAPVAIAREAIRNMLLHDTPGSLVHISSVTTRAGAPGLAMYAASKGALEAFSRNLAREWGPRGIRSNCVVPGFMDTAMTASLPAERRAQIARRTALRRPLETGAVAEAVAYLLGESAGSVTGQELVVDNGLA